MGNQYGYRIYISERQRKMGDCRQDGLLLTQLEVVNFPKVSVFVMFLVLITLTNGSP